MAKKKTSGGGVRHLSVRVKTAKKRKPSSARWLKRQLNDPYVQRAKQEGYRSRAAYKLLEMDDQHRFLKPGKVVLDLGAAPGGWTQVAVERTRSKEEAPHVVGIDILAMPPVAGAHCIELDFMRDDAPDRIRRYFPKGADIVLSDMAPNTTGHAATDHLRIMVLLEAAYDFALELLTLNGVFIGKIWQGGTERELLARMKKDFAAVRHVKPKASRQDSSECYVLATGYRGGKP